ncbi:hypothetical protein ABZ924_14795 [Streptomyces sp. NPDC046876]|uniref:hypothetical protein n=1 Tax=Streptomyces sp. NPDC046876 TaxID=3155616 RepID=UPI0033FB09A6
MNTPEPARSTRRRTSHAAASRGRSWIRPVVALPLVAGLALTYTPAAVAGPVFGTTTRVDCDEVAMHRLGFRMGSADGLEDGRVDGRAEAYKKSYDDVMKSQQGITEDECRQLGLAAYKDAYGPAYEKGFAEGSAEGKKAGKEDAQKDKKTGLTRNVRVNIGDVTVTPATGPVDCKKGVAFSATLQATSKGIVNYHWEKAGKRTAGTVEFVGAEGFENKTVTLTAPVAGASGSTVTALVTLVIDSGPSKGVTHTEGFQITCQ